jgi:hypothetical protein
MNLITDFIILLKISLLDLFFPHIFKEQDVILYTHNKTTITGTILEVDRFAGVYKIKWKELNKTTYQTMYHVDYRSKLA